MSKLTCRKSMSDVIHATCKKLGFLTRKLEQLRVVLVHELEGSMGITWGE